MTIILNITDRAAEKIRHLLERRDKPTLGIRVGVRTGGCSGLSYVIEYAENVGPYDEIVEQKEIKVIVDAKAVMYLLGCQMDYIEEKFKSGFVFSNPNATGTCGCGESFNV